MKKIIQRLRDPGKSIVARELLRRYIEQERANRPKITGVWVDELPSLPDRIKARK